MDFTKKISMMKEKRKELDKFISSTYVSKSLKFFIDDILFLIAKNNFSIKEQKEILEEVLEFEINYQTYASFYNRNIKSKLRSNKNVKSENKKDGSKKEVVSNEDFVSSNETNIKNDSASVSKKDTNVNEDEETFSLIDKSSNNIKENKDSSIKKIDKSLFNKDLITEIIEKKETK